MRVLGIETSCDETGVAIYDSAHGLLAHALYSQIPLHRLYGGVVPELASRDHVRKLLPLIDEVLATAQLQKSQIDAVAYTAGPGLIGALLVGAGIARSLAFALNKPAIGIHHMEAHLLAPLLEIPAPTFPFLALLVSGGHTLLVEVDRIGQYKILGQSLDDAVGEAFDKTAKLLGLPYPGGPALAELAEQGSAGKFILPRPMLDRPGLDFSFSGLKTSVVTAFKRAENTAQTRADLARAFQEAAVETLCEKCRRALEQTGLQRLVVAGGVGANKQLRARLRELLQQRGGELFFPRPEFCTDNGAMVAFTGYQRLLLGQTEDLKITVRPRWSLEKINS